MKNYCNGLIGYNKLLVRTNKRLSAIPSIYIKKFIYNYFKYGYMGGNIVNHKWEAFKKSSSNIAQELVAIAENKSL